MAERRGKGDGSLTQRHDHPSCPPLVDGKRPPHKCRGRWVAIVDLGWQGEAPNRRRIRKVMYGRTRKEAQIKLATANAEKRQGELVVAAPTVEVWLRYWLDEICTQRVVKSGQVGLKVNTMKSHRQKVERYLIPHLGRHRLDKLAPEHVRAMYKAMRDEGLSEATLRQTYAILRRALEVAMREGKVGRNVADLTDAPSTEKQKRTPLTLDQARQVLAIADLRGWVALYLGLRQGEALGLLWSDVDLDRGWLWVRRGLVRHPDRGLIFERPKSTASVRDFPIPPKALAQFKLARVLHDQAGGDPEGLIFHRQGQPVDPRADWQAWTDLLSRAGVPHVALHAARNTTASLLEAAGVPARVVAQILGQSTIEVTYGYQHSEAESLVRWMLALDDYVTPEPPAALPAT